MTTWNGLYKLPILISGKALTPFSIFELRYQKWSGDGPKNTKLLNIFGNLERGWSLVIGAFYFPYQIP